MKDQHLLAAMHSLTLHLRAQDERTAEFVAELRKFGTEMRGLVADLRGVRANTDDLAAAVGKLADTFGKLEPPRESWQDGFAGDDLADK